MYERVPSSAGSGLGTCRLAATASMAPWRATDSGAGPRWSDRLAGVNLALLAPFLAAVLLIQLTPGPGMLFIVANGITGGVRALANNLANPKVVLFFVGYLPQFVDRGHGHVTVQFLVLGAVPAGGAGGGRRPHRTVRRPNRSVPGPSGRCCPAGRQVRRHDLRRPGGLDVAPRRRRGAVAISPVRHLRREQAGAVARRAVHRTWPRTATARLATQGGSNSPQQRHWNPSALSLIV